MFNNIEEVTFEEVTFEEVLRDLSFIGSLYLGDGDLVNSLNAFHRINNYVKQQKNKKEVIENEK